MNKKDYGAIIFTPADLYKNPTNQSLLKKYFVPEFEKVSNARFDKQFPQFRGGFGAYDLYTKNNKLVKDSIYMPERALKHKNEMYSTLVHENFHKREHGLSQKEYGSIDRLDKSRLLNDFFNKLKEHGRDNMTRSEYIKIGMKLDNHEILAEYSGNFPEYIGAPTNYTESVLNRIWFQKKWVKK